jgi:FMN-binding domain
MQRDLSRPEGREQRSAGAGASGEQTLVQRVGNRGRAGPQPQHGNLHVWRATQDGTLVGHVFVDEVIGRQSLITYAIGIDAQGALHGLEILSYRESHGGEIRNPAWRAQFEQRGDLKQLRFETDIKNIAGATHSSEHVTQGIRWLLALWQTSLREAHGLG